jgi:hypothetical protein
VTHIIRLDRSLLRAGSSIILRRQGTPNVDVSVPASWRLYKAEELTGGIQQGDIKVIISPTGLSGASWLAAAGSAGTAPFNVDRAIPRPNDKAIIAGRIRNIQVAMPIYVRDVLVRIELQVRG